MGICPGIGVGSRYVMEVGPGRVISRNVVIRVQI